jgi:hypothetical protein
MLASFLVQPEPPARRSSTFIFSAAVTLGAANSRVCASIQVATQMQRPVGSISTRPPQGASKYTSGVHAHRAPRRIGHESLWIIDVSGYPCQGQWRHARSIRALKSAGTCRCADVRSLMRVRRRY